MLKRTGYTSSLVPPKKVCVTSPVGTSNGGGQVALLSSIGLNDNQLQYADDDDNEDDDVLLSQAELIKMVDDCSMSYWKHQATGRPVVREYHKLTKNVGPILVDSFASVRVNSGASLSTQKNYSNSNNNQLMSDSAIYQVDRLNREKEKLEEEIKRLREDLRSKNGEIQILRERQKEFTADISAKAFQLSFIDQQRQKDELDLKKRHQSELEKLTAQLKFVECEKEQCDREARQLRKQLVESQRHQFDKRFVNATDSSQIPSSISDITDVQLIGNVQQSEVSILSPKLSHMKRIVGDNFPDKRSFYSENVMVQTSQKLFNTNDYKDGLVYLDKELQTDEHELIADNLTEVTKVIREMDLLQFADDLELDIELKRSSFFMDSVSDEFDF